MSARANEEEQNIPLSMNNSKRVLSYSYGTIESNFRNSNRSNMRMSLPAMHRASKNMIPVKRASFVSLKARSTSIVPVTGTNYVLGILYMLGSAISLSLMGVCVQFGQILGFESLEMLFCNGAVQLFLTILVIIYANVKACIKGPQIAKELVDAASKSIQKRQPSPNIPTTIFERSESKSINIPPIQSRKSKHIQNIPDSEKQSSSLSCKQCSLVNEVVKLSLMDWVYLVIRGIIGFAAAALFYTGLESLPLGDAITTFSTFPIWTFVIAFALREEKLTAHHILALVLFICGILLIAHPSIIFGAGKDLDSNADTNGSPTPAVSSTVNHMQLSYFGLALCLIAAFVNAFSFFCLRQLAHMPAYIVVTVSAVITMIGSAFAGLVIVGGWKPISDSFELVILLLIGLCGFAGQYLITKATQFIPAGIASLICSSGNVFGFVWQVVFFNIAPSVITMFGAVIVVSAIGLISIEKLKKTAKPKIVIPLKPYYKLSAVSKPPLKRKGGKRESVVWLFSA